MRQSLIGLCSTSALQPAARTGQWDLPRLMRGSGLLVFSELLAQSFELFVVALCIAEIHKIAIVSMRNPRASRVLDRTPVLFSAPCDFANVGDQVLAYEQYAQLILSSAFRYPS
jgi:hypothetical protein